MPNSMSHPLDLWQYRISSDKADGAYPIGEFWLNVGPELPVTRVTDSNGVEIGFIIGFAIAIEASEILKDTWVAPVLYDDPIDGLAETLLWALGGRYIWVATLGEHTRIYPDAGGQVTCVFDPELKIAGATALSLMDDATYDARLNQSLFHELGVDGEGWFPAGLTAHHGLLRLLPNHFLDLADWKAKRFTAGARKYPDMSTDQIVDRMISITQSHICLLYTSPSPRDKRQSRMPSSA